MTVTPELTTLFEAANEAQKVIYPYWKGGVDPEITIKEDGSKVTLADTKGDAAIAAIVRKAWPDCVYIGEEQSDKKLAEIAEGQIAVVTDPIDGTKAFINQSTNKDFSKQWATSIALIQKRDGMVHTIAAVVAAPALGELYAADANGAHKYSISEHGDITAELNLNTQVPASNLVHTYLNPDSLDAQGQRVKEGASETVSRMRQKLRDRGYNLGAIGSPALALVKTIDGDIAATIVREDNIDNPTGFIAPWDPMAGRFIAMQAGLAVPTGAKGNIMKISDDFSLTIVAKGKELANDLAEQLRAVVKVTSSPDTHPHR